MRILGNKVVHLYGSMRFQVKHTKKNMPLVDRVAIVAKVYGAVCQLIFEHDSGDTKAPRSQSIIYRYVLNVHCRQ